MPRDFLLKALETIEAEEILALAERPASGAVVVHHAASHSRGFHAGDSATSQSRWIHAGDDAGATEGEGAEEEQQGPPTLAADFGCGRFIPLIGKRFRFAELRVLSLAGSHLPTGALDPVLDGCRGLQKLDASRCGLSLLPLKHMWVGMAELVILLLHGNALRREADLESATAPQGLRWFTGYENPWTFIATYRQIILAARPELFALDLWMVSDAERLGTGQEEGGSKSRRFSYVPVPPSVTQHVDRDASHGHALDEPAMLASLDSDLDSLKRYSAYSSAACCIQTNWRGLRCKRRFSSTRVSVNRAVLVLQRSVRAYLWRTDMRRYLKAFVKEFGDEDLLLGDKEIYELKAQRLIERGLRRWIHRRRREEQVRKACELLARKTRGYLVRRRVLYEMNRVTPEMTDHPNLCVYFPERVAWGFLMLLNIVHKTLLLAPLSEEHVFDTSDVIALQLPPPDEVPERMMSCFSIQVFGRHCVLRPRRSGRFPKHPWDGPALRLAGGASHVRSACLDRSCWKAFVESCAPGEHPTAMELPGEEQLAEDHRLRLALEAPSLPEALRGLAAPAAAFVAEAAATKGPKWPKRKRGAGIVVDPATGRRNYATARWSAQRLLVHRCASARVAANLWPLLVSYNRAVADVALLRPIPFITGMAARDICATVVIQSAYRAYRARCDLGSTRSKTTFRIASSLASAAATSTARGRGCEELHAQAVAAARAAAGGEGVEGLQQHLDLTRAAIRLQRCWRWSWLKRRFVLLRGAADYVEAVRSPCFFVEERMYMALHLINGVRRYPKSMSERHLRFGFASGGDYGAGSVVLINEAIATRKARRGSTHRVSSKEAGQQERAARPSLPTWLLERLGAEVPQVGPGDTSLQALPLTPQALLRLGAVGDHEAVGEEAVREVSIAALEHLSRRASGASDVPLEALRASGGRLRLVEFRFPSLAQAKLQALALYLCTFSFRGAFAGAVPLMHESQLQNLSTSRRILDVWEHYGLSWPEGDRVAQQRARQQSAAPASPLVSTDGAQELHCLERPDRWATAVGGDALEDASPQSDAAGARRRREEALQEAVRRSYERFAGHVAGRRAEERSRLEARLATVEDAVASAPAVAVSGAVPPTTSARADSARLQASYERAERAALRQQAAERREAELRERRERRAAVEAWRARGKEGRDFENRIYAFHSMCEEQRRRQQEDERQRLEEEAQRLRVEHYKEGRMMRPAKRSASEDVQRRSSERELELERRAEDRAAAEMRSLEEARERVRRHKARSLDRKSAAQALQGLVTKKGILERGLQEDDMAGLREARSHSRVMHVASLKEKWGEESMGLQQRARDVRQYRIQKVNDLKIQLSQLANAAASAQEAQLGEVRARIGDQKAVDRLVHAAREQLAQCEQLAFRPAPEKGGEDSGQLASMRDYEAAVARAVELAGRAAEALHGRTSRERVGPAPPPPPMALPQKPRELAPQGRSLRAQASSPRPAREDAALLPPLSARGARGGPPPVPGGLQKLADPWLRKLGGAPLTAR